MRTPWQSTKRPERAACKTREIEHAEKKFANENEKPAEEGKPIPRERAYSGRAPSAAVR